MTQEHLVISEPDPLLRCLSWIAELLTGSVATSIAIAAVAILGFSFLQGRIDVHRAGRIAIACFLIFGAPTIAVALAQLAKPAAPVRVAVEAPPPPVIAPVPPRPPGYDPYAGAAVPVLH